MPILNYTTTVSAEKTVSQIQAALAKAGAQRVSVDYDDEGPAALAFALGVVLASGRAEVVSFRLPADFAGVGAALKKARVAGRYQRPEHVRRVAWRIVKDWLEAQLAMIEAGVARPEQVLLPYAVAPDGRTLFEHFAESPNRLLTA